VHVLAHARARVCEHVRARHVADVSDAQVASVIRVIKWWLVEADCHLRSMGR